MSTYNIRVEIDSLGEKEIPADAYWGVHTQRAIENFPITGIPISYHKDFIRGYAIVKKACALANRDLGFIDDSRAGYIVQAAEEIVAGELLDQFPVDILQGGAGTSTNMNINEVIANRALELSGHNKGDYSYIHPLDHVNRGQSTNDTYPTALKISLQEYIDLFIQKAKTLVEMLNQKAEGFADIATMGRTQLQDAVPVTFGQIFSGYAYTLSKCVHRLEVVSEELGVVNIGGTAIGTGITTVPKFGTLVCEYLTQLVERQVCQSSNLVGTTSDASVFVETSGALKSFAVQISKISSDLRLMGSGPQAGLVEISLPKRQAGSSIMPGKVNPVIPESVNQTAFYVAGFDAAITMAAEAGQLQLNAFEPLMSHALFSSISALGNAVRNLSKLCVEGIEINKEIAKKRIESSVGLTTELIPYIGYEKSAAIAKEALQTGEPIKKIVLQKGILPDLNEEKLDWLLDGKRLSEPGPMLDIGLKNEN
jgi:aspartate ammonia-lyase